MIHTANACVTLSGSVVVRGAIISKYFTASGNAGVYFDDSFDADIPGFDNNGGADKMKVIGWI